MKRVAFILLVLLMPAFQACMRDRIVENDFTELSLYLECPGDPYETKGKEGEITGSGDENAIHSLRVWVFNSETHEQICTPLNLSQSQLPESGRVRRYALTVSTEFARTRPNVDVFAIANAASVGFFPDDNTTWDELNDAMITDSWFGVASPVRSVDPTLGLPMTGVAKDMAVQGQEPVLKLDPVKLSRAVAKLRYVFCRMADDENTDAVSVDNITLKKDQIPVNEYLFTQNAYAIAPGGYVSDPLVVPGVSNVAKNPSPEKLVYADQGPVAYERLIDQAVADGKLSDCGVIYLRESDKALEGVVNYTINGDHGSKNFYMNAQGDFARNRTWIMYGYFMSDRNLQLSVRALPWDYSKWTINFSDQSVQASQLTVDETTADVRGTDVYLLPGVTVKCHTYITSPVSGKLIIRAIGDASSFVITPEMADIDPDKDAGHIEISIRKNPHVEGDVTGHYINLSFCVELGNREIDANSEIRRDNFRFIL